MSTRVGIRLFGLAGTVLSVLAMSALPTHASPTFQPLGFLSGDSSSYANAVSGNGLVVVGQSGGRSFRWTADGGMQDLGLCPVGNGGYFENSSANGVSYDGSVVVGGASTYGYTIAPYRWTAGTGMVRLHDEMGYAYATDVSDNGYFTVGYQQFAGWRNPYANDNTVIPMFEGTFAPVAQAVSGNGNIVVGHGNWGPAFRWTGGAPVAQPLSVPAEWNPSTKAYDISRNGAVIVGAATRLDGSTFPCRWTAGTGGFEVLGTDFQGEAYAASGDGSVIVGRSTAGGGLIWDAAHGLRNLQVVLANDYGFNLNDWILSEATGISSDGKTIVGYGLHNGQYEGFVAVLPEPTSLSLLGLGGLALMVRRKRK